MSNGWPSFAQTNNGQEIATLHLLGYPLAATQQELTEMQRLFLLKAIPEANKRMNGDTSTPQHQAAPRGKAGKRRSDMARLRQQMAERQKGG